MCWLQTGATNLNVLGMKDNKSKWQQTQLSVCSMKILVFLEDSEYEEGLGGRCSKEM
jgi:hypothetical protein